MELLVLVYPMSGLIGCCFGLYCENVTQSKWQLLTYDCNLNYEQFILQHYLHSICSCRNQWVPLGKLVLDEVNSTCYLSLANVLGVNVLL